MEREQARGGTVSKRTKVNKWSKSNTVQEMGSKRVEKATVMEGEEES